MRVIMGVNGGDAPAAEVNARRREHLGSRRKVEKLLASAPQGHQPRILRSASGRGCVLQTFHQIYKRPSLISSSGFEYVQMRLSSPRIASTSLPIAHVFAFAEGAAVRPPALAFFLRVVNDVHPSALITWPAQRRLCRLPPRTNRIGIRLARSSRRVCGNASEWWRFTAEDAPAWGSSSRGKGLVIWGKGDIASRTKVSRDSQQMAMRAEPALTPCDEDGKSLRSRKGADGPFALSKVRHFQCTLGRRVSHSTEAKFEGLSIVWPYRGT